MTWEEVFDKENMAMTIQYLLKKKDSCGIDGILISDLPEYWRMNGDSIQEMIRNGEYMPQTVQEFEIIKTNGKRRVIAKFATVDRFLLRLIEQILSPQIEEVLSPYCYAYRSQQGIGTAVQKAAEYLENGFIWVMELDIENFFDNIKLDKMEKLLFDFIKNEKMQKLIYEYLHCTLERDYHPYVKEQGLVQGNPLSPIFSNLYLLEFDKYLEEKDYHFIRFADNINIYFETRKTAIQALELCRELLAKLHLYPNSDKTGIYEGINRRYLGYEFVKEKNSHKVIARKYKRQQNVQYHNWHAAALQRIDKNYHIIHDGILSKKDYTLLFEKKAAAIPLALDDGLR